jgi:hypothetical protein
MIVVLFENGENKHDVARRRKNKKRKWGVVVGAMGSILIMNLSKGWFFVLKMLGTCTFKKLF